MTRELDEKSKTKFDPDFVQLDLLITFLKNPQKNVLPKILTSPLISDAQGRPGANPDNWLSYAVFIESYEHVELLLKSTFSEILLRASYDADGRSALDYAIEGGFDDIAILLMEHGAPLSKKSSAVLFNNEKLLPFFCGNAEYFGHILSSLPGMSPYYGNWLLAAITEKLLEVTKPKMEVLQKTSKKIDILLDCPELAKLLLIRKTEHGLSPIEYTLEFSLPEVTAQLLEAHVRHNVAIVIKKRGHLNSIAASTVLIEKVISSFPEPPEFSYKLSTPDDHWLTYAAWKGATQTVEAILNAPKYKEFFLDRPGENKRTALEWAMERGKLAEARLLLDHGAQIRTLEIYQAIMTTQDPTLIKSCHDNKSSHCFQLESMKNMSATKIQSYCRSHLARKMLFTFQKEQDKKEKALQEKTRAAEEGRTRQEMAQEYGDHKVMILDKL